MKQTELETVIKEAELYSQRVTQAFLTCPKKKKHTPYNRVKVSLKYVNEATKVANILGELARTERMLNKLIEDYPPQEFNSVEDLKEQIIGDLQIQLMELNNLVAKLSNNPKHVRSIEDIVEGK